LEKYIPGFDESKTIRKDIGECIHLFTHIKRTMFVELVKFEGTLSLVDGENYKWVTESEMMSMAIPTTLKKAFALLTPVVKKRKTEKNQSSIMSFLKKVK